MNPNYRSRGPGSRTIDVVVTGRLAGLTLADVDPNGALSLSSDFTAAFLEKLTCADAAQPADIAHALIGMIAETVGTLASAVAAALHARRIIYGGGTLRDNPPLREILAAYSFASEHIFLQDGEFTGALGAIELAAPAD